MQFLRGGRDEEECGGQEEDAENRPEVQEV